MANGAAPSTTLAPAAPASPAPATAFTQPGTMSDDYGADTGDSPAPVHKPRAVEPFGNGPVAHGNVLHVKMDGPIEKSKAPPLPTASPSSSPVASRSTPLDRWRSATSASLRSR